MHNAGEPLIRTSPYVRVVIPPLFEWKSKPIAIGGHNVKWDSFEQLEYMVTNPELIARIEVLDDKDSSRESISYCDVRVMELFSPSDQILDLFYHTFAAGSIQFKSEFTHNKLDSEAVPVIQ